MRITKEEKIRIIRAATFKHTARMYLRDTQWTAEVWYSGLRAGKDMEARKTKKYAEALSSIAASVGGEEYRTKVAGNTVAGYWQDLQCSLQAIADGVLRGGAI